MRAREVTLEQLFHGDVSFVSPSFQRPYNWVGGACERVFTGMTKDYAALRFQGAVVSMALGKTEGSGSKSLLIDGNHRLMTVLVVLLAVRDALGRSIPDAVAEINRECFLNGDEAGQRHFKNIVPRKDRATFEHLIAGTGSPAPASPLLRAYKSASEALQHATVDELLKYREHLVNKFTFVLLSLERDEDPYPVFKLLSTPGEDFTRRGLREYTRFSPDPELMAMIAGGESQEVEFKERVVNKDRQDLSGATAIARSVAGFMNSFVGGVLLIGVRDDGTVRGVDAEYDRIDKGKGNWDGFSLFLNNTLRMRLTTENPFLFYSIERHRAMDHDVCVVRVKPAATPVYLDKHLFVRSSCQTIEMLGPDLINYVATRWPRIVRPGDAEPETPK